ncbi:DUF4926 domain-containing protein [Mycolicibacterium rhodesiae]|uniref:DUF4926 domain-containing protein n=1 Tax=Mycolicibacterium rhodesiae TaxID=36814 RepID=A0A1X0J0B2_MYCRH|nr:DUF4926 domain-containing protein [Mycolicibacterium rhodesiae]MCV7345369.1 DUF4926 domain-containing protein [Mycolicibacterium rhodesiae]ORB54982.1 hypothetical protein BST42_09400 [Mycolicibacterium rhodesiae]
MSPQENDVVRLLRPLPQYDLAVGAQGTVVMVYRDPGLPPAYKVEFADEDGVTQALVTLKDDDVEVTWRADT